MLLPAVTGSGASLLVTARSATGFKVVGSLAVSSLVSISPPPDTDTWLLALGEFTPTLTVSVIAGKSAPLAIASVLVQVSVVGPGMPPPSGVQVQPDPLNAVAVKPAGSMS